MTARTPNLVDRIAGIIPGYRGYAAREGRRTEDKRLRETVATTVDRARRRLDAVALELVDEGQLDPLDDLDRLRRAVGRCADTLRFAEAGGSGLMDDVVVKEEDLDRVHQHDLALSSEAAELVAVVEGLDAKAIASSVPDVRTRAESFLRSVEARAEVLRQVF